MISHRQALVFTELITVQSRQYRHRDNADGGCSRFLLDYNTSTRPACIYLLKVDDRNIVNFEHISHLALMFLMLTLSMQSPAGNALDSRLTSR